MGNAQSKVHPDPDAQNAMNIMPIEIYGPNYVENEMPEQNEDAALPNDANAATTEEVAPTRPDANPPGDEDQRIEAVLEDGLSKLLHVDRFVAWTTARDVRLAVARDLSKRHGLEQDDMGKNNTRGGRPEGTRVYSLHELYSEEEEEGEPEQEVEAMGEAKDEAD